MCNGADKTLQEFWEKYKLLVVTMPVAGSTMGGLLASTGSSFVANLPGLKLVYANPLGHAMFGHSLPLAYTQQLVQLVEQQAGDTGQARLGVAHGGGTVAVPAAKIALAIDQRVAL